MTDLLQSWFDACDIPLLAAFILGLLTALSPCPLATNITAIGFISKDIDSRRSIFVCGMVYTLGRTVAYTALGAVLIYMLRCGIDTFNLQASVSYWGEMLIAPVLILFGVLMLLGDRLPLGGFGVNASSSRAARQRGVFGSFLLGVLFALAFCPTSGLLYFGMLIPMSASAAGGYALPAVYALATGLPVVAVAWIVAFSVANVAAFYRKMQVLQRWLNRIVALLFIVIGLYYVFTIYL